MAKVIQVVEAEKELRRKRGKMSKRKGGDYEAKVCRVARPHLSRLGWDWQRTPRSGGWKGASKDPSLRKLRGDITVPDDCVVFPECKNREGWSFDQYAKSGLESWAPYKWLEEARPKAEHADKVPILMFSRKFLPDFVLISEADQKQVFLKTNFIPCLFFIDGHVVYELETFIQYYVGDVLTQRRDAGG